MRLTERQRIAAEKAKAIMDPDDYDALSEALSSAAAVSFWYTNRYGDLAEYKVEYVHSFFEIPKTDVWPGSVNLWSFHDEHKKKEQYNVERIFSVGIFDDIVRALVDMDRYRGYWFGVSLFPERVPWWREKPIEPLIKPPTLFPERVPWWREKPIEPLIKPPTLFPEGEKL